jgi:hypothetical protein
MHTCMHAYIHTYIHTSTHKPSLLPYLPRTGRRLIPTIYRVSWRLITRGWYRHPVKRQHHRRFLLRVRHSPKPSILDPEPNTTDVFFCGCVTRLNPKPYSLFAEPCASPPPKKTQILHHPETSPPRRPFACAAQLGLQPCHICTAIRPGLHRLDWRHVPEHFGSLGIQLPFLAIRDRRVSVPQIPPRGFEGLVLDLISGSEGFRGFGFGLDLGL